MCTQRARRLVDWIWNEENEIKHKVSGTQSIDTGGDADGVRTEYLRNKYL